MKKLSSTFYMWFGFGVAMAAVLAMFLPCLKTIDVEQACSLFWNKPYQYNGAWPSFVGYMLILLGGIAMGVIAFPTLEISAETEKIVLISAGVAILLGTILALLEGPFLAMMNPNSGTRFVNIVYYPGMYITGVLGVGAVAFDVVAVKLDW